MLFFAVQQFSRSSLFLFLLSSGARLVALSHPDIFGDLIFIALFVQKVHLTHHERSFIFLYFISSEIFRICTVESEKFLYFFYTRSFAFSLI